jgi:hypothetical protein
MYLTPHFSAYRVDESVEFFKEIENVFNEGDPAALQVEPEFIVYKKESEILREVYKTGQKSVITVKIEFKDKSRDKDINGITALAKAYLHHYDAEIADAAILILSEIDKYGGKIAKKNYQAETAVLDDLVDLYKTKAEFNAAVQKLNMADWFTHMETENNDFKVLMKQRDEEEAGKPKQKTSDQISVCIEKYEKLIMHLTAYGITQPSELHETVENMINQIIEKYNNIQRRGRKSGEEPPAEDE